MQRASRIRTGISFHRDGSTFRKAPAYQKSGYTLRSLIKGLYRGFGRSWRTRFLRALQGSQGDSFLLD